MLYHNNSSISNKTSVTCESFLLTAFDCWSMQNALWVIWLPKSTQVWFDTVSINVGGAGTLSGITSILGQMRFLNWNSTWSPTDDVSRKNTSMDKNTYRETAIVCGPSCHVGQAWNLGADQLSRCVRPIREGQARCEVSWCWTQFAMEEKPITAVRIVNISVFKTKGKVCGQAAVFVRLICQTVKLKALSLDSSDSPPSVRFSDAMRCHIYSPCEISRLSSDSLASLCSPNIRSEITVAFVASLVWSQSCSNRQLPHVYCGNLSHCKDTEDGLPVM